MARSFAVGIALAVSLAPVVLLPVEPTTRTAPSTAAPPSGPDVTDRLPNLRPVSSALADYDLRRRAHGRVVLRFIGAIVNVGRGPLHVVGRREGPPPEPGGGRNELTAYQRIDRSDGSTRLVRIGTMVWHRAHRHFHLARVVHYRLLDRAGRVVRDVPKVTFCLRDNLPLRPDLPGFVNREVYGNCAPTEQASRIVMGISVGWTDVYGKHTPGQTMDVTDLMRLPRRRYTLEMTVNPDGVIREVNRFRPQTRSVEVTLGR
jgi:hypothetical protein